MQRSLKTILLFPATVLVAVVLGASCLPKSSIDVDGFLFGRPFATTVDHQLAAAMMTEPESQGVIDFFAAFAHRALNTQTLSEIASEYSMDVSTLYFIKRLYAAPRNRDAQDTYLNYIDLLTEDNMHEHVSPLEDCYVVFIPGLDYLRAVNGGDFAEQRALFSEHGIANELMMIGSWGFTDDNAAIIADRLRELNRQHDRIILVSSSKGGLDLSVALGKLLRAEDVSSVVAWLSVGGILKGTPVADRYLKWPRSWVAGMGLRLVKQRLALFQDVSYEKRSNDFAELRFPEHINRFHFVGAPLSTRIHRRIKSKYCLIKEFGPNDGFTPLADELTEGGTVITALDFDHYYRHPRIHVNSMALALTVVTLGS